MGGLNEEVIQTKPKRAAAPDETIQAGTPQAIRRHEDTARGEVHFHVDAEGLKVAVPTAQWAAAWGRLKAGGREAAWEFIDAANKTLLHVSWVFYQDGSPLETLDAAFVIRAFNPGPTFLSMDKFTEG